MYKHILINAELRTGKRDQETELTGRSPTRRRGSALGRTDILTSKKKKKEEEEAGGGGRRRRRRSVKLASFKLLNIRCIFIFSLHI